MLILYMAVIFYIHCRFSDLGVKQNASMQSACISYLILYCIYLKYFFALDIFPGDEKLIARNSHSNYLLDFFI